MDYIKLKGYLLSWTLSVHQLNGVNRHQVSRLKRGTVLVNFVVFGNRFLFFLSPLKEELCIGRCSAVQAAGGCTRADAKLSVVFHPVSPKGTLVTWFPLFLH
jgi:hypothetical protein